MEFCTVLQCAHSADEIWLMFTLCTVNIASHTISFWVASIIWTIMYDCTELVSTAINDGVRYSHGWLTMQSTMLGNPTARLVRKRFSLIFDGESPRIDAYGNSTVNSNKKSENYLKSFVRLKTIVSLAMNLEHFSLCNFWLHSRKSIKELCHIVSCWHHWGNASRIRNKICFPSEENNFSLWQIVVDMKKYFDSKFQCSHQCC